MVTFRAAPVAGRLPTSLATDTMMEGAVMYGLRLNSDSTVCNPDSNSLVDTAGCAKTGSMSLRGIDTLVDGSINLMVHCDCGEEAMSSSRPAKPTDTMASLRPETMVAS